MDNKNAIETKVPAGHETPSVSFPDWVDAWRQNMQREGLDFMESEEWLADRSDDAGRDVELW